MAVEWSSGRRRRAAVHGALSDPARLAVVDALSDGDLSPSELQQVLGISSNLLAHHLRVLEEVGLVRRSRSEGDRRRTYLTLVPEVVGGVSDVGAAAVRSVARVVFVCTHNSARSQLAVALWNMHSTVPVASAGTEPAVRINPGAVAAARRGGLRMDVTRPRHVDDVIGRGDLVVAVCDHVHEQLDRAPRLHWSIPDPSRVGTKEAFDRAIDELSHRIERIARHIRVA